MYFDKYDYFEDLRYLYDDHDVRLYRNENWKMTKNDKHMLDSFLHKSIWRMLKIYWPQKVTTNVVRIRAEMELINTQIKRRRWKWL